MQHRDRIVLQKIIQEINIAEDMLGSTSLERFLEDEKLKRQIIASIDVSRFMAGDTD